MGEKQCKYLVWLDNREPFGGDKGRYVYVRTTRERRLQRALGLCLCISPARHVNPMLGGLEGQGGCQRCFLNPNSSSFVMYRSIKVYDATTNHTLVGAGLTLASKEAYDRSNSSRTSVIAASIHSASHPATLK